MRQVLILPVDLVPFVLQPSSDLPNLIFSQNSSSINQVVLLFVVLCVQVLDHRVFGVDVLFYSLDVLGDLPVVWLLCPV